MELYLDYIIAHNFPSNSIPYLLSLIICTYVVWYEGKSIITWLEKSRGALKREITTKEQKNHTLLYLLFAKENKMVVSRVKVVPIDASSNYGCRKSRHCS